MYYDEYTWYMKAVGNKGVVLSTRSYIHKFTYMYLGIPKFNLVGKCHLVAYSTGSNNIYSCRLSVYVKY